jgi:CHC2 zinc finger
LIETKPLIREVCRWLFNQHLDADNPGWQTIRPCPLCQHKRGLSVNVSAGSFKAHCCGKGGDSMRLIMAVKGIGFQEAVQFSESHREKGMFYKGRPYRF